MSWQNRYLIIVSFLWLARIRWGLWRSSFQDLQQQLSRSSAQPVFYPFHSLPSLNQLIWSVKTSSRLMPGNVKCLAKALCAQAIAHQFNYNLNLHIGVAKEKDNSLEAHAWLTYQNQVVLGSLSDLNRFSPLLSLSSPLSPSGGTA